MEKGATFSRCGRYRYSLWRRWEEDAPYVLWICLNPSTADAEEDDPTLRRCMGFAQDWGYGASYTANLFAWRATKPQDMMKASDPIGPNNNKAILRLAHDAGLVIAAWGNHGAHMDRASWAREQLPGLHFLKLNASGEPAHPLYLPQELTPQAFPVE